eukprot:2910937-Pleurochrysis_carterae.AAC.1
MPALVCVPKARPVYLRALIFTPRYLSAVPSAAAPPRAVARLSSRRSGSCATELHWPRASGSPAGGSPVARDALPGAFACVRACACVRVCECVRVSVGAVLLEVEASKGVSASLLSAWSESCPDCAFEGEGGGVPLGACTLGGYEAGRPQLRRER